MPKTSLRHSRKTSSPVKTPPRAHQRKRIQDIAIGDTHLFTLKSWRDAELAQESIDEKQQRFNVRDDMGNLFEFAESLREGITDPLRGYMGENGKFQITDGERRWRGAKILSQKNIEITIPVIREPQGYTARDRDLDLLRTNNGKPLTMIEQARAMKRLLDRGEPLKGLHKLAGCSPTHVADCLSLIEAPEEIQQAVSKGEISGTTAADLTRRVPDRKKQVEVLAQGRARAKEQGKTKVTAKHLPVRTGKKAQKENKQKKAAAKSRSEPQLALGPTSDPRPPTSGARSVPASAAVQKLEDLRDASPRGQAVPSRYETLELLIGFLGGDCDITHATKFILGII